MRTDKPLNALTRPGIVGLMAVADHATAHQGTRRMSSVDRGDGMLVIINAREHIADSMFLHDGELVPDYADRVETYHHLADIQHCLMSGETQQCRHCGEMQGLHLSGGRCNRVCWTSPTAVLSKVFEAR